VAEIAAGVSATEVSRREGLRHQTLLWWKWRLGHEQRVATKKGARERPEKQALTAFLPVETNALQFSAAPHDVIVELPHLAVRVPVGADPGYVAALVHALRAPC
jgi:transposase-like protein